MQRDFIHNLFSSFNLWFDHTLLQEGQAYTNVSGQLYKMNELSMTGYYVYGSPYKQWVYDSSISGATVPNKVFTNGSANNRGTNGLKLDHQNGRAIFETVVPTWTVTASYAVKDFNIYTTTKSDSELVFETRYMVNPTMAQAATGVTQDSLVAPCIFLKLKGFKNEPLTFGGQDKTIIDLRAVILSDDEFKLNAVGNLFIDTAQQNLLTLDSTPLNRYNDTKNGYFNYLNSINSGFAQDKLVYIKNVSFTKLNQQAVANRFPDLYVGFLDFKLEAHRFV